MNKYLTPYYALHEFSWEFFVKCVLNVNSYKELNHSILIYLRIFLIKEIYSVIGPCVSSSKIPFVAVAQQSVVNHLEDWHLRFSPTLCVNYDWNDW